jgi:hypothetical protein
MVSLPRDTLAQGDLMKKALMHLGLAMLLSLSGGYALANSCPRR